MVCRVIHLDPIPEVGMAMREKDIDKAMGPLLKSPYYKAHEFICCLNKIRGWIIFDNDGKTASLELFGDDFYVDATYFIEGIFVDYLNSSSLKFINYYFSNRVKADLHEANLKKEEEK